MKIKCSFCEAADKGSQSELQDKGWSKAIFRTPIRKTVVTCPAHIKEFNMEIIKIMKPDAQNMFKNVAFVPTQ